MSITPQLLLAALASLQSPTVPVAQDKIEQCISDVMDGNNMVVTSDSQGNKTYTSSGTVSNGQDADAASLTGTATIIRDRQDALTYAYSLRITAPEWGNSAFGATATKLSATRITLDFTMANLGDNTDEALLTAQTMVSTLATQNVLQLNGSIRACLAG